MSEQINYNIDKIVIVEDDFGLNKLLQIKLEALGFDIVGFSSGEEAVEFIKKNQNVFLLTDYHLSNMLAYEIINELHENGIIIPFIIITGKGDEKLAVEMMRLGALDYVVKDAGFHRNLSAIITRALNHYETKQKLIESQKEITLNEEKYRRIFENIYDIYIETDTSGNILEISPSCEKIFLRSRKDLINKKLSNLFVNKKNGQNFVNFMKRTENIIDYEIILKDKDDNNKYCSITTNSQNNIDGTKKIIGIIRDISHRKKLENQILNQVIETEEKERRRFSEDLHDGLGPLLSSIKIYINMIGSPENKGKKRENLIKYTNELIDEAISSTRFLANNLMPNILYDYGLKKAVESFVNKINHTEKVLIQFESNIENRLNQNIEIVLYRSILELIHNTLKHANAENVKISLSLNKEILRLNYSDDGIGFDINQIFSIDNLQGNGLRNIANRVKSINADFNLKSEKNKGMEVNIEFDLQNFINN